MSKKSCPVARHVLIRTVICAGEPAGYPKRKVAALVKLNGLPIPNVLLVELTDSFVTYDKLLRVKLNPLTDPLLNVPIPIFATAFDNDVAKLKFVELDDDTVPIAVAAPPTVIETGVPLGVKLTVNPLLLKLFDNT